MRSSPERTTRTKQQYEYGMTCFVFVRMLALTSGKRLPQRVWPVSLRLHRTLAESAAMALPALRNNPVLPRQTGSSGREPVRDPHVRQRQRHVQVCTAVRELCSITEHTRHTSNAQHKHLARLRCFALRTPHANPPAPTATLRPSTPGPPAGGLIPFGCGTILLLLLLLLLYVSRRYAFGFNRKKYMRVLSPQRHPRRRARRA